MSDFQKLIDEQKKTTQALQSLTGVQVNETEKRERSDAELKADNVRSAKMQEFHANKNSESLNTNTEKNDKNSEEEIKANRGFFGRLLGFFTGNKSSEVEDKKKEKSIFNKIAKGLSVGFGKLDDLTKNFRENLVDKGKDVLGFLKKAALVGLLLMLPKILNSQAAKDIVKFVEEKVIPFFGKLKDFLVNTLGEDGALVVGLIGLAALVAPATTFTAAKLAVTTVSGLITGIGTAFTAISGGLTSIGAVMGVGAVAAAGTILAVIAAVVSIAYGLYEGIVAFKDKFAETGDIFESAKTAFATFLGEALGLIPNLLLDLTGYIAGLFGFDKFKEKIQAIDVAQYLTDSFLDLFDKVSFWIRALFLKIKPVLDKVGDFLQPAVDTVKSIADFIMKLLSPFKVVIDKAKSILKGIGGAIGDLFSTSDEERQEQIAMEKRNIEMMREQDEKLGKDANKFAIERAEQRIAKLQSEMGPDLDTDVEVAKLEDIPERETVKPVKKEEVTVEEIVKPVEREPVTVANAFPAEAPVLVSNNSSSSNTNNYANYGIRVTANDTSTMHIVNQN